MDKVKLARYAEIKSQIKALESEAEEIGPEILEAMGDNKEVESEFGMFIKASRRKWTYPTAILDAERELKEEKKQAERLGDATYEENEYLLFKGPKSE